MCGFPQGLTPLGVLTRGDAGSSPTTAGRGFPMNPSAGRPITTDAGASHRIGWFWVPGNRWGPAWVYWQQSDDYLAWAPLPPAYSPGVSINISFGDIPAYYWSAVPSRYFLSDDLPRYY